MKGTIIVFLGLNCNWLMQDSMGEAYMTLARLSANADERLWVLRPKLHVAWLYTPILNLVLYFVYLKFLKRIEFIYSAVYIYIYIYIHYYFLGLYRYSS